MPAPQIKSRKPTGQIPFPLILLEGPEKAGKSLIPVVLSRSPRVGMMYWFDLGEGAADEYAALEGSNYEVVEHDGSYRDILEQMTAVYNEAKRAAEAGEPPISIVVDSMSAEWTMLVNWTNARARRSRGGQSKLEADPDAEIDPTSNLWNDANNRHARIMDLLMTFPGIAIITGRGKEVAVMGSNGVPVEGKKTWKVEGQKNMAFDASAWIRLQRDPRTAELVGVRSLRVEVPERGSLSVPMTKVNSWDVVDLEAFIFDVLGCSETTKPRDLQRLSGDALEARLRKIAEANTTDEVRVVWEATSGTLTVEDWETFKAVAHARVAEIEATATVGAEEPRLADPEPEKEVDLAIVGDSSLFATPHEYEAYGDSGSAFDRSCVTCGAHPDEEGHAHTNVEAAQEPTGEPAELPVEDPPADAMEKAQSDVDKIKAAAKPAAKKATSVKAKPKTSDEPPA